MFRIFAIIAILFLALNSDVRCQEWPADSQNAIQQSDDISIIKLAPEQAEIVGKADTITEPFADEANQAFDSAINQFEGNRTDNGLTNGFERGNPGEGIGSDFFGLDDNFEEGLLIRNDKVAMKIGGFVKVDAIYDLNPIGSTDSFDVATIEVGAPPRENARLHARQTRLNWDTRWRSSRGPIRMFVESDFFFNQRESAQLGENRFRLRHAYGQHGNWIVGQTWTTLSDLAASPATLDFEGQVASITTRRTQIRWTRKNVGGSPWLVAFAIEDPFAIIEVPEGVEGEPRTQTPDAVIRFRRSSENVQLQIAGVVRTLGFQPTGEPVIEGDTWGVNFTQVWKLSNQNKVYSEILWGQGIGSFRGAADVTRTVSGNVALLGTLAWMVGTTHDWTDRLSSNFTYAENGVTNEAELLPGEIKRLTYMAVNLIYEPTERTNVGIEYLYGRRQNFNGDIGNANRVQVAFTYFLP